MTPRSCPRKRPAASSFVVGFTTADAIDAKRKSLEGVLVPLTARWNEQLLSTAGFRQIHCVWRCFNFAAWVGVK